MSDIPPETAALTAQLRELNERIRFYLRSTWQVPLSYLGLCAVGLPNVLLRDVPLRLVDAVAASLATAGVLVIWWSSGHFWRAKLLKESIDNVESLLRLPPSTQHQRLAAKVGVIGIAVLGILVCLASAWTAHHLTRR